MDDERAKQINEHYSRAMKFCYASNYEAAIVDFTTVLELNALSAPAFFHRGFSYARIGWHQEAIEDYTAAIAIEPALAKAYHYRGISYKELGELELAIADYTQARILRPDLFKAGDPQPDSAQISTGSAIVQEVDYPVVRLNLYGKPVRHQNRNKSLVLDLDTGISLELMYIPTGIFYMGSVYTEAGRDGTESPQRWVGIRTFWLGKTPVTQQQWQIVSRFPKVERVLLPEPSGFQGPELPVENISWFDAVEFCARLSLKTGLRCRLPSESEWEFACRGGTATPFHLGETITTSCANYYGESTYGYGPVGEYRQQTTRVGEFDAANAYGLHDMHGLVWEWCADSWHDNYLGAPTDGAAWETLTSEHRVLRGGSWFDPAARCRSAARHSHLPDVWLNQIGLRVAIDR